MIRNRLLTVLKVFAFLLAASLSAKAPSSETTSAAPAKVPGVIIDHSPASSGIYIGSPSIAILPSGDYVASHDHFGPKTTEHQSALTAVFRSTDRGASWRKIGTIDGQFWSTSFVHRGALYIIGTDRHHGNAIIRRSADGGASWTSPTDARNGLLRDNGEYHCGPMPVMEHRGRLWRAIERRDPPKGWGITYCAGVLSVPVDADLLNAANWTFSNLLASDAKWLGGTFGGWLEGNAVAARDGKMLDVLRVDTAGYPEKVALVNISADGRAASFDPTSGFRNFPGGAKKFTIRFDAKSDHYWALATIVPERHQKGAYGKKPGGVRNTLALTSSPDLTNWTVRCILLHHPDTFKVGFQYVDWLFDGDDIVAACRTAFEDGLGGAHNNHDANFLTFHRWKNFRKLTQTDNVPMHTLVSDTRDFIITGWGWTLEKFANGERAFANRDYVWREIPERFGNVRFTRIRGGEHAEIRAVARRNTVARLATAVTQKAADLAGWTRMSGADFRYTDADPTQMTVFTRPVKAGEEIILPQVNWTGSLLLVPDGGTP
jgi:hypothetical protein